LCCITKNGSNPAYAGARIGASRVAKNAGCKVKHFFPNIPDDIGEQKALIETALMEKPDAILLAPAHPTALNETIQKIQDKGIPLVYFVSRAEGVEAQSFISSNNFSLAREIADYLLQSLSETANIVIMEGSPNSATSLPRTQGFLDAIANHNGCHVVAQRYGNYQREDAYREMVEVLATTPKIDGVLSANDFMALGIIDALAEANRSAPIVGVNAMPQAIAAIKSGTMQATAAYDAMKMACVATQAAIRLLSGLSVPDLIELPVEIINASNCALWDQPYEERPLAEWEGAVVNAR